MSEPIIKMDAAGQASIISYNVPEPTSYSGRNIIELEFDIEVFNDTAKKKPEGREAAPDPTAVEEALDVARDTGVVNESIFPNAGLRHGAPVSRVIIPRGVDAPRHRR